MKLFTLLNILETENFISNGFFPMDDFQKYHDKDNHKLTQLINGIRNKDEVFILKLYDNYAPALYGVVHSIILNVRKAEDVLQKVFIKVCDEIKDFNAEAKKLFIWLCNIARNEAIEALKTLPYHYFRLHSSDTATHLTSQKVLLTPLEDTILTLAFYRRMSCIQIGELLQLPLLLVRKNMQSGYSKLLPQTVIKIKKNKSDSITQCINISKPLSSQPLLQHRPFLK